MEMSNHEHFHVVDAVSRDGETESVVSDTIIEKTALQVESLSFKDSDKWCVHDGNASFQTTIEDTEFLAKIDAGTRFGKGDLLVVDLGRIQSVVDRRLVGEYRVVKVREHRTSSQGSLL
jgi:hypothetical protein